MSFGKTFENTFQKTFGNDEGFSPSDISSLYRWYDANVGVTLVGGNVSSWADRTGNTPATQTTANDRPQYQPFGMNNKPVLRFDGVSDYLSVDLTSLANIDFTIYAVIQRASNKANNYFTGTGPNGVNNQSLHTGWRSDTSFTFAFWANDLDDTVPAFTSKIPVIAGERFSETGGKDIRFIRAGVLATMADAGQTTPLIVANAGRIGWGVQSNAAHQFDGDIAELFYFTTDLTNNQEAQMETYISNKWGIVLP